MNNPALRRLWNINDPLKFFENGGMVLRKISDQARIAQEPVHISGCQNKVEMIGTISLLNQLKLPVQTRRFPFHQRDLLCRQPFYNFRRPAIS